MIQSCSALSADENVLGAWTLFALLSSHRRQLSYDGDSVVYRSSSLAGLQDGNTRSKWRMISFNMPSNRQTQDRCIHSRILKSADIFVSISHICYLCLLVSSTPSNAEESNQILRFPLYDRLMLPSLSIILSPDTKWQEGIFGF